MIERKYVERVGDVFKSIGQPTVTYVAREEGRMEASLRNALQTSGQLCLVTGPSKTGKTTLYKRVLSDLKKDALVVRCDASMDVTSFWAAALESINFERIREKHREGSVESTFMAKVGGTIGWSWLAGLLGEASIETSATKTEGAIRERILSQPSPLQLIPVLQKLPVILVVEDYHYLRLDVQKVIFQQWKVFVDEEVSVLVLGTTHHAVDIVSSNKDLLARKFHLEVTGWQIEDLKKIVTQGFDYLDVRISKEIVDLIAKEAVGLPIIAQQICEQMFISQGIYEHAQGASVVVDRDIAAKACRSVASERFGELAQYYQRLIVGPRKRARKYDTYEQVLACFAVEPLKFSLARHEIDRRLNNQSNNEKIPAPSVTSMLNALARYQSKRNIELLEWRREDNTLYMLEPAFLFFLRWGVERKDPKVEDWRRARDYLTETIYHSISRKLIFSREEHEKTWKEIGIVQHRPGSNDFWDIIVSARSKKDK